VCETSRKPFASAMLSAQRSTVEVEGPTVERWADNIADANGFRDVSHTLEIFGTCNECPS